MNEIVWAAMAEESYIETLRGFLDSGFTDTALALDDEIEKLLERLRRFSSLCPVSLRMENMRKCVINSRFSLVYRTSNRIIEIIALIDNRSNHDF